MTPFWSLYFTLMSFVLGACVGSFLNVCIYRIPNEESVVKPRSHCPKCGKLIAWYDNIPLFSYIALAARCRHCGSRISPRYFLVEGLVAVLFLAVWHHYGWSVLTPIYWLMVSGLVLGTFVDFDHLIIPDRVSLGGIAAGLVLSFAFPVMQDVQGHGQGLLQAAIGAAVGSGLLWGVAVVGKLVFKKDAMGLGDVKLLGAIGAFLGWRAVLFTIIVSSFVGSIVGVYFVIARRKEWQSRIPYGPYLALAAMGWVLGGQNLWHAYVRWLTAPVVR